MNTITRGLDGKIITIANLPPRDARWTMQNKYIVVMAVEGGLITLNDCQERWDITHEEFTIWRTRLLSFGKKGLRQTRIQEYRA